MSYEHLAAGTLAGLSSSLLLHPLDLVKLRFAVDDGSNTVVKKSYSSISNAFVTIVREEGFRGLYKGTVANCIGSSSAWGIYFLLYNAAKDKLRKPSEKNDLGIIKNMTAAAFSGLLTTTLTNPIWVVKTRLCLQYGSNIKDETIRYTGTLDAFKKIVKHEGFRGLYKGLGPGLFGVAHGAVQLAAYEELKTTYIRLNNLPNNHHLGTFLYLTFAAGSKLLAALVTYPYQVVRARQQDQHTEYKGLRDVMKREGVKGFYKGLSLNLVRVVPATGLTFVVYEKTREYLS